MSPRGAPQGVEGGPCLMEIITSPNAGASAGYACVVRPPSDGDDAQMRACTHERGRIRG